MATFETPVVGTATLEAKAKLGFKVGLESALSTLATATSGTFYLTSDTHRLFIGNSKGELAPVNPGILTVANVDALTTFGTGAANGTFCYVTDGNILAVRSAGKWIQINDNTIITNFNITVAAKAGGGVTVSHTITEKTAHTQSFDIVAGDNVTVEKDGNGVKISAADAPVYTQKITETTAANNITGVTLGLQADGADAANSDKLTLSAGSNVQITKEDGKYVLSANLDAVNSEKITKIDFANRATGFGITLTKNPGSLSESTVLDPKIKIGDKDAVSFKNGIATLDTYSTSQIDQKLKDQLQNVNALIYKGAVSCTDGLPTAEDTVSIGDVYMQSTKGVMTGQTTYTDSADIGTLWIAQAAEGTTEEADGFLAAKNIVWTRVDNYNTDTTYTFTQGSITGGQQFTVQEKITGNGSSTNGSSFTFGVAAGAGLNGSVANNTLTIKHPTVTPAEKNSTTVTDDTKTYLYTDTTGYLTGLTFDAYGHVTEYSKKGFQVKAEGLMTAKAAAATATTVDKKNGVKMSQTLVMKEVGGTRQFGDNIDITSNVVSETLSIAPATGGYSLELEWGSF